jgi:hypothetical protein
MLHRRLFLFLIVPALLFISGCAKYSPRPLGLPHTPAEEKNNLTIQARLLQDADVKEFFGECSPAEKGYHTVQLTIANQSTSPYILDTNTLNIDLAPTELVADKVGFNTVGRIMAWGIPGLFIWPFLIPACIDGVKAANANKEIRYDFASRGLTRGGTYLIRPRTTLNKVMFVTHEDLQSTLEFDLTNQLTHNRENFSVTLR